MKTVYLNNSEKIVLVDDDFYEYAKERQWREHTGGYAITSISFWRNGKLVRGTRYMHRIIMNAAKEKQVDHIDHNKLNNCRANLRICTASQNSQNMSPHREKASKYKGVSWDKTRGLWHTMICKDNVKKNLGRFLTEEEAANVYNLAATKLFGEFACLNKL